MCPRTKPGPQVVELIDDEMNEDKLAESVEPQVAELNKEFFRSYSDNRLVTRVTEADEVRYAYWEGQSSDGRKHAADVGAQVHPWEGASDTRILLADHYINVYVALLSSADNRAVLNVNPTEYSDSENASAVNLFLMWLLSTQMNPQFEKEMNLVRQYAAQYGWAGVHTVWRRSYQKTPKRLTMESLASFLGVEGTPAADNLGEVFSQHTDILIDLLVASNPSMNRDSVEASFQELAADGETTLDLSDIVYDYPEIVALQPWHELVLPPETRDVKDARAVFRRESMTIADLADKVESEGWDKEWFESVKKTVGNGHSSYGRGLAPVERSGEATYDTENLVDVIYAYSRRIDSEGIVGVYLTIFSPYEDKNRHGDDLFAKHEAVKEAGGDYPIEIFTREHCEREVTESRGIPFICSTWQSEMKGQVDMLYDRSNLETVPPLKVPMRYGNRITIGPGMQLSEQRPGDISWMEPPRKGPDVAMANMEQIRLRGDEYFGVKNPKIDPSVSTLISQYNVDRWLIFKSIVIRNIWELVQQFGSDQVFGVVTGTGKPIPRDERSYNMALSFDVRELDDEFTNKQIEAVSKVASEDPSGSIDHAKLTALKLRAINPSYPNQLILSQKQATQQMFDEENTQVALMALGNAPKLRENDPAAEMRLQFVNQILSSNPKYQELVANDPRFAELLKQYSKNLEMSVMQKQNAVTGRLGVNQNA